MIQNKVGVSTVGYMGLSLEDAMKGISKAGFAYIEIAAVRGFLEHITPDKMTNADINSLMRQLKDYNLELVSVSGHSDLTKRENISYMKSCIDLAEKMGAEFVNTGAGEDSKDALRQFYENMKELGEYALEKGITIGLETHGGICPTGRETAKVVRNINSEGVKINYDTANVIFYSDIRPEEDIKYALDYIGHVHLKDKIGGKGYWNQPPLGDGDIDFELLFQLLIDRGYAGPFIIEIEFEKDTKRTVELADEAVRKSHDFLDNLFSKLSG